MFIRFNNVVQQLYSSRNRRILFTKMIKILLSTSAVMLIVCSLFLSGCVNQTDDPTNIEHEVLRVSLLEKELKIDELLKTIDQNSSRLSQLEKQNIILKDNYEKSQNNLNALLLSKSIEFLINDKRENYVQPVNGNVYVLGVYDNQTLDLHQEILYLISAQMPKQEIFRGENITFYVNASTQDIIVLDKDNLYILDNQGSVKYKANIDLNNPQVDMVASLQIDISNPNNSCMVLLTRDASAPNDATSSLPKKKISRLQSIVYYDYSNLSDITSTIYYFDTNEYVVFPEKQKIAYVKTKDDESVLEVLNLRTQQSEVIQTNILVPFDLKVEGNTLYYHSDDNILLFIEP